jgi:hypothetical protein
MKNMSEDDLLNLAVHAGHLRYVHSVIFKRETFQKNETTLVAHLERPMFETVRDKASRRLIATYLTHYWRESQSTAESILSGSHGIDPELTGITEEMRLALVDKNRRLHLAVAAGYVRIALKAFGMIGARDVGFVAIVGHASAHLARPEFADLADIARFEISDFAKDGLLNGADKKIGAARAGDYAMFWQMANESLGSWPKVSETAIDPELLA